MVEANQAQKKAVQRIATIKGAKITEQTAMPENRLTMTIIIIKQEN